MIRKLLMNPKLWLGLGILIVGFVLILYHRPPLTTEWSGVRPFYWWQIVGFGLSAFGAIIVGVSLSYKLRGEEDNQEGRIAQKD